jgi:hypothetical protein
MNLDREITPLGTHIAGRAHMAVLPSYVAL